MKAVVYRGVGDIGLVDAERARSGPAAPDDEAAEQFDQEVEQVAPERADGDLWQPGDAPTQAVQWAVEALAKTGTSGSSASTRPPSPRSRSARR